MLGGGEPDLARTATAAASAKADVAGSVGPMLGRYRIERELGAGAMGVVHAAFDPDLKRRVALKVLRGATASREAKDRLMREARAMARLAHPNVVVVHEVGTAGGRDFVAMELVHGETLAAWLRSSKRSPAAIIDAFLAAGRGLAAAHAAGIVHRDFKPHNVLRGRDGRIVVTDFGLARQAEGGLPVALDTTLPVGTSTEASTPSSLERFTATGALLGTLSLATPVVGQNIPRAILDKTHRDDLVAHVEHASPGDLTVCASSYGGDLLDPDSRERSSAHLSQLAVTCRHIGPDTTVVELDVPPQPRFD